MAPPRYATPEDAEVAFYEALEKGDVEAMMAVWAEDEEVVCIHPGGQRLCGHAEVRAGWTTLFAATPRFTIERSEQLRWQGGLMAVHSLMETFYALDDPTPRGPLQVTNVFIRGAEGWRLLSHHVSIGPEGDEDGLPDVPDIPADGTPRVLH